MFGFIKRKNNSEEIDRKLKAIGEKLEKMTPGQDVGELEEVVCRQEKMLKKQGLMLEEMVEELEELPVVLDTVKNIEEQCGLQIRERDEQERRLVEIVMQYEEYMGQTGRYVESLISAKMTDGVPEDITVSEKAEAGISAAAGGSHTSEWNYQKNMMTRAMKSYLEAAGLEKTGRENMPVDFDSMEVLQTEPVSDAARHGIVCQVVIPGWRYKGKVIRKAKVIAYQYTE